MSFVGWLEIIEYVPSLKQAVKRSKALNRQHKVFVLCLVCQTAGRSQTIIFGNNKNRKAIEREDL